MNGLKDIAVTFALIGLFAFAIIMFGISFASKNNASTNIGNDPAITSFNNSVAKEFGSYSDDANQTLTSFSNSNPLIGSLSLIFESVGSIWKTIVGVPFTVYNLTIGLVFKNIFGSDPAFWVIIGTFTSLIFVIIVLYAWQWIRQGTP